ncbi:hypothetical protein [Alkalibacillus almallahensis]|uniref:hypothetical protein n=1 Tax=Alkalibacillus almallahensis TaxID=1379154 RepID=UPI00142371BD|nr:hypothetical protein [Alkalibacillus almallahensis]NIK10897.1 putative Fe-S cluster-containing protein [Alkalibacillus almallahensis]
MSVFIVRTKFEVLYIQGDKVLLVDDFIGIVKGNKYEALFSKDTVRCVHPMINEQEFKEMLVGR